MTSRSAMVLRGLVSVSSCARFASVAWGIGGLAVLVMLIIPTVTLPADDGGILRRFISPEITPSVRISQSFQMTAPGLSAIEIEPTPVGLVSGEIRIELHDITGHEDSLRRTADVRAEDIVRARKYRFDFSPLPESNSRFYRLDLTSPSKNPAHGVAIRATKGERYAHGSMLIDGVPRWADLAFRAEAPAPSGWDLLMRMEPWKRSVVLLGLAGIWTALGVSLRALAAMPA